jgi:molecular chaperone IbpA
MTRITTLDLPFLFKSGIGFDRVFNQMETQFANSKTQNYPPYNIIRNSDENYLIEIAAAGFLKPDIAITMENGTLTVNGQQTKEDIDGEDEANGIEYLHRGLSRRNFVLTFNLAEYVEVKSADMNNGILSIHLEKKIPEAMKPQVISIK